MKNPFSKLGLAAIITGAIAFSCEEEIDESNLYTFTGETIADYIAGHRDLTLFNEIMTRVGYDKMMSTYGNYTCFAPTNEGILEYIDSLYNDTVNITNPHNGMTAPGMEGLTDSLCMDIALFHLLYRDVLSIEMDKGNTFSTMLNREISTSIDPNSGEILLNGYSKFVELDIEVENGMVHILDHALRRSNALVSSEFEKYPEFSIFHKALKACALDQVLIEDKRKDLIIPDKEGNMYIPKECQLGYTIFAEKDATFARKGIKTLEDLIDSCKVWYANCTDWYDYYKQENVTISTGTDYESPYNVLNIFMRYHIVKGKLPYDKLYRTDGAIATTQVTEFHETILPNTIVKISRVNGMPRLNRWVENTSLTDQVYDYASADIAKVRRAGMQIQNNNISSLNGYIHPINDILVYDKQVPDGVLNERMRYDLMCILHEAESNNLRRPTVEEIRGKNGGVNATSDGNVGGPVIKFPENFFDNMVVFNGKQTRLIYNAAYSVEFDNFMGDEFAGQGQFDLAVRMPPVPAGNYEIRFGFSCWAANRAMTQLYMCHTKEGEKPTIASNWMPIDIPIDMRVQPDQATVANPDPRTGYCPALDCADMGVESDANMRYMDYMRAPAGWYYSANGKTNDTKELRTTIWKPLRRIIYRGNLEQGNYWIRFKTVLPDQTNRLMHIDYFELVPEAVYNNSKYLEDMF